MTGHNSNENDNAVVNAVELIGVTKRYRNAAAALDDVTLTIPRGSTLGLVGQNGAGKTTAIRILMGTLAPTAGTVRVLGIDVASDAPAMRRRVGYVPERHDAYGWMTVAQVIRFARPFYPTWDDDFARGLLEQFALDARARIKTLSKGQRARAGLVVALAYRPRLLVLDEPSSGLDPIVRRDLRIGLR